MDNFEEIVYETAEEFIKDISYKGKLYNILLDKGQFIFRGESSDKFNLIPSALREDNHEFLVDLVKNNIRFNESSNLNERSEYFQIMAEYICLQLFYSKCDYRGLKIPYVSDFRQNMIGQSDVDDVLYRRHYWLPYEYFELAGLAQHYGLCTRFIDWTQDINIAIYFANKGFSLSKGSNNIVIWALNVSTFDSYKRDEQGLKLFIPEYAGNPNLCAQKGVFSLYQIRNRIYEPKEESYYLEDMKVESLDQLIQKTNLSGKDTILYKFVIPYNIEIINYLKKIRYDSSYVFPGYRGVVKSIKDILSL